MNVNIAILTCLTLVARHEKLLVEIFIQLIEDKAALRRHQRAVRVGVALVADVADRLALRVDIVHHMDKIHFIIAVVTITLCDRRAYLLQRALHDVVHLLDRDALLAHLLRASGRILAQFFNLLRLKLI